MKVKLIEYAGKQDVYNMEVADVHSFVVNHGIVAHNCYDETKYFLMARPVLPKKRIITDPTYYDPYGRN